MLFLSKESESLIKQFFISEINIKPEFIVNKMHLTGYYSRRLMLVDPAKQSVDIKIPINETRVMVMAPDGENPKPNLIPATRKVGIQIRKIAMNDIYKFREKMLKYESKKVLDNRNPSNKSRNAFGSCHFQTHISLLKPRSMIQSNLRPVGKKMRNELKEIHFDKFVIKVNKT